MDACRSKKQDENGDDIGQLLVDECSTSCYREVPHENKHRRILQVNAESSYSELGKSIQEESVTALVFDECWNHVEMAPRSNGDAGCDLSSFEGRCNPEGDLPKNEPPRFESRSMDFIDLTEDEDTADRKRKRSQAAAADEAMEICPVCSDRFPREVWYPEPIPS